MEPTTERNSLTKPGTIVSKWHAAAAAATTAVTTRAAGRPTTRIVLATATFTTRSRSGAGAGHTVYRERERRWKRRGGGVRQWRKCGRRHHGRARPICSTDIRCACSPDSCPAGAHVRCGPLGSTRFTRDDQKRGSRPGTTIHRHRPRYDGVGHAAAGVRRSPFSPCPSSLSEWASQQPVFNVHHAMGRFERCAYSRARLPPTRVLQCTAASAGSRKGRRVQ